MPATYVWMGVAVVAGLLLPLFVRMWLRESRRHQRLLDVEERLLGDREAVGQIVAMRGEAHAMEPLAGPIEGDLVFWEVAAYGLRTTQTARGRVATKTFLGEAKGTVPIELRGEGVAVRVELGDVSIVGLEPGDFSVDADTIEEHYLPNVARSDRYDHVVYEVRAIEAGTPLTVVGRPDPVREVASYRGPPPPTLVFDGPFELSPLPLPELVRAVDASGVQFLLLAIVALIIGVGSILGALVSHAEEEVEDGGYMLSSARPQPELRSRGRAPVGVHERDRAHVDHVDQREGPLEVARAVDPRVPVFANHESLVTDVRAQRSEVHLRRLGAPERQDRGEERRSHRSQRPRWATYARGRRVVLADRAPVPTWPRDSSSRGAGDASSPSECYIPAPMDHLPQAGEPCRS